MNDFALVAFILFGFTVSNLLLITRMERGRRHEITAANRRLDDVAERAAEAARLLASYHVQLQRSTNLVADKLKATDTMTADKLQAADAHVAHKLSTVDGATVGVQEQAASLADLAAITALASKVQLDEIYELLKKVVPTDAGDPPS